MIPTLTRRTVSSVCWMAATAMLSAPVSAATAAQDKDKAPAAAQESGLPVSMAGFSDKGVFELYKNEERLVTSTFDWRPDGSLTNDVVLSMAGQEVRTSFKYTPDADGRFKRIEAVQPGGVGVVERDGPIAKTSFKEQKGSVTLRPDCVLFENMTPVFMSLAVKHYDRAKGGKQTFPVFVVAGMGAMVDASFEYKETVERTVGTKDLKLDHYTYYFPGVDMEVYAGPEDSKIYFADVPAQRACYVREGYGALRKAPVADASVSQPTFEVVEQRGVKIKMRDGVSLSTDLYLPKTDQKVPVILTRTPYKKEMSELDGKFYARRGYAMAIQDCRGRFASEGEWEPFVNEREDGYDTIEWLAAQPWSSGKVGMIGGSYLGWVQWWALSQKPPHLTTIIPNVSPPEPFYNFPYEYGVFFVFGGIWWADIVEQEATGDLSGEKIGKIFDKKFGQLLRDLPVIDADKKILGKESKYWRRWIEHNTQDDYWARASYYADLKDARIPVFHQSGWFDGDGIGSKLNYATMKKYGHPNQKLILGPWGHQVEASRKIGDWDFGPAAAIDLPREYLRWFDHWLKGMDNGVDKEPLVRLFAMDSNVWLEGDTYPLPQTKFEKWYIRGGGAANTSKGDGKLTREAPGKDEKPDKYVYDPGDPTPNPSYFEQTDEEDKKERSQEERKKIAKEHHQSVTEERKDILVYTSDVFDADYTFAGPLSAKLCASTSAKDTDWYVRLLKIDKDNDITPLVEGRLRARYRDSMSKPTLLEPGKTYTYDIDMWQTGITIKKGSRLRVEIASATYPLFSRNLNTGGNNETETQYVAATQTIYHDAARPTYIVLPMIPMDGNPASPPTSAPPVK